MFCNIKKLTLNNILFYFLLILIILAGGILFKKYTNIYEGYTEDEVEKINTKVTSITEFVNTENTKMENEMNKLKKDDYDKMVESMKKYLDLKLKSAIWKLSEREVIEQAYKEKEMYDKITSSGGVSIGGGVSSATSGMGSYLPGGG